MGHATAQHLSVFIDKCLRDNSVLLSLELKAGKYMVLSQHTCNNLVICKYCLVINSTLICELSKNKDVN